MFNYMNVGFVQNRPYEEKIHATELSYGMRDCVMTSDDFAYDVPNHRVGWGRAIMGGTPVRLGSTGEYFDLPANYTGPVTLKRVLNGVTSTVEMLTTAPGSNTDTTYYFKLYDISNGNITQDYRSIDWVHSFYLKNLGGSNIAWVLNGFESDPFDAAVLAGNRTLINEKDIAYDDSIHGATPIQDILLDIFNKSRSNVGNDKNFITSFLVSDTAADLNNNLGTKLNSFLLSKIGVTIPPGTTYSFSMEAVTGKGITDNSYESANICRVSGGRFNFEFEFQYNEFANVRVINPNLKQEWSLDELGLDGSWHMTNVATNIKKAYDEVVSIIGNKTTFSITQGLFLETDGEHYGFASAIVSDIEARYGADITGTYAFEFSIKFGEYQGITSVNRNVTNFITIQSAGKRFYRHFHHDNWATSNWTDEVGAPHADMMVNVESYMTTSHGLSINAPYRNYISGITFWVADYDSGGSQFTTGDATIRYVPRAKPKTNPTGSPSTDADTLFAANQSILNSKLSSVTPVTTVTEIGNMYLNVSYGEAGQQYPDGITLEGLMEDTDNDVILAMIVIHYGKINWDDSSNWLAYAPGVTYTPSLLNQPITTPEVGDNMEETSILKEVLDNA